MLESSAKLVDALLQGCPELTVLATTQANLQIAGERVWPVAPLSVPDPPADDEAVEASEAVSLFCARAAAVKPGFAATGSTVAVVAEICRRLDGIPLAIELAAARIAVLTPRDLVARLNQRFQMLTGGSRAVLPRHQTLRLAVDWSHGLLTDNEQVLLRRLSVFAGGFGLRAAEDVCGEAIGDEVLSLLGSLVSRSLVVADTTGIEARYSMLETIRLYAGDRLTDAGETVALQARHADWCLALAETAEPELTGPDQVAWMDRLEAEHDNLRAALAWVLAAGEAEGPAGWREPSPCSGAFAGSSGRAATGFWQR
ncbi:MAG: hypothetical protein ABR564_09630 [Candidatus Dormibacteria bacterium]